MFNLMQEGLALQQQAVDANNGYPRFVEDDEDVDAVLLEATERGLFLWADPMARVSIISRDKPVGDFHKVHGVAHV